MNNSDDLRRSITATIASYDSRLLNNSNVLGGIKSIIAEVPERIAEERTMESIYARWYESVFKPLKCIIGHKDGMALTLLKNYLSNEDGDILDNYEAFLMGISGLKSMRYWVSPKSQYDNYNKIKVELHATAKKQLATSDLF